MIVLRSRYKQQKYCLQQITLILQHLVPIIGEILFSLILLVLMQKTFKIAGGDLFPGYGLTNPA